MNLGENVGPGEKAIYVSSIWAVRSGDIGIVPIPAAAWLLGSALGMLGWLRKNGSAR